jgi:hypothetical protein
MEADSNPDQHRRGAVRPARFSFLLAALFLMLAVAALGPLVGLEPRTRLGKLPSTLVFVALLASAAYAVSARRETVRIVRLLSALTVVLFLFGVFVHSLWVLVPGLVVAISFLGWTIALVLRKVFAARLVDYETIAASLCVYMLIGVLWALLYSLVDTLQPGSFTSVGSTLDYPSGGFSTAIYFSFVTLTTLGYGDVSPLSEPARFLAILEAILGQLFLVVLVARLVGLNIAQETRPNGDS